MNLNQEISSMIAAWLEERPRRNLRSLTRLTGLSYSSVWRAANAEGDVSQRIAVNIASALLTKAELKDFFQKHFPNLVNAVAEVKRDGDPTHLRDYLISPDHFKLIMLASANEGTNEEEVVRMYGEKSLPYFDDLKESGDLVKENGNWYCKKEIEINSLSTARKVLANITNEINPINDTKPFSSYAYVCWESLTVDAAKKVYDSIERFNKEVFAIVSADENKGDVLVTYGLLQNVIKGQEKLV